MSFVYAFCVFVAISDLSDSTTPQQGELQGIYQSGSAQAMERGLGAYLNAEELKSILTPGDMCEWKIKMKAGEVLVGDARSQTFDPAIEIVDDQKRVVASNDDRYPGDQRPLVFWRCQRDGEYGFQVRSFQNKAGGQVFARFQAYMSYDLLTDEMVEREIDAGTPFLLRVPMRKGQVKDIAADPRGDRRVEFAFLSVINPLGLPERSPSLAEPIFPALRALIAPLDGDYYLLERPLGEVGRRGIIRVGTRTFNPIAVDKGSAQAEVNRPAIFEVNVKKGDLLEASTPSLALSSAFRVTEAPDLSRFSLDPKKPEDNPFIPLTRSQPPALEPALDFLPARARDGRMAIFRARRDARIWLASDGVGSSSRFAIRVRPAAAEFLEAKAIGGTLETARTDYWAFDAKAGDVMTFDASCVGFSPIIVMRDPDLGEIRRSSLELDKTTDNWRMIVQQPGRYLLQLSCLGDGGSGKYTLKRQVLHPKEFGLDNAAKGEIDKDQIQIWKFTATPDAPVFVRWSSTNWSYEVTILDENGQQADFQRQPMDEHSLLGILKVDKPRTYIVVLTGKERASYTIELTPIPGYARKPTLPAGK